MPEIAVSHRSPIPSDLSSEPWLRAIILVDMNAFGNKALYCISQSSRQINLFG